MIKNYKEEFVKNIKKKAKNQSDEKIILLTNKIKAQILLKEIWSDKKFQNEIKDIKKTVLKESNKKVSCILSKGEDFRSYSITAIVLEAKAILRKSVEIKIYRDYFHIELFADWDVFEDCSTHLWFGPKNEKNFSKNEIKEICKNFYQGIYKTAELMC
jgi:hypothetical protein